MTIQVRFIRETEEGKEYVQQNKGGGNRFVQFENSDATFADLLDCCFQIYFIGGENYFYEKREDVEAVILDVSERVVSEEKFSSFLSARGLFPSKTWFYFKTIFPMVKQENIVNVSDESDVDRTEGKNKRKICDKCSHTYFYSCLFCEQNENYEA